MLLVVSIIQLGIKHSRGPSISLALLLKLVHLEMILAGGGTAIVLKEEVFVVLFLSLL